MKSFMYLFSNCLRLWWCGGMCCTGLCSLGYPTADTVMLASTCCSGNQPLGTFAAEIAVSDGPGGWLCTKLRCCNNRHRTPRV